MLWCCGDIFAKAMDTDTLNVFLPQTCSQKKACITVPPASYFSAFQVSNPNAKVKMGIQGKRYWMLVVLPLSLPLLFMFCPP